MPGRGGEKQTIMAQYYTLEEAAQKLGLSMDEFRRRLATEWKSSPRRYPDGATLRFQSREIDELSRTLGRSSDPDLQLGDSSAENDPFVGLTPEDDALAVSKGPKAPADSDVKLEASRGTVRPVPPADDPATEEINLADEQKAYASKPPSSKVTKPKSGKVPPSPKVTQPFAIASDPDVKPTAKPTKPSEASSEFELSLAPDSSDEFELELTDDGSDEVELGTTTKDLRGRGGDSGINLQDPADSGISLEKSSSEFELQIEDSGTKKKDSGVKKKKSSGKIPPPPKPDDSDSEFELSMDQGGPGLAAEEDATTAFQAGEEQKDIFETDFELPTLDDESGSSEQAAVEAGSSDTDLESSDFDLALDEGDAAAEEESGSQVVALDEDEPPRARRRTADGGEEDLDELDVADDVELEAEEAEDEEAEPRVVAVAAQPAEWGALPTVVLVPCVLVMFLVGLMSFELLHGMWGYQTGAKVPSALIRSVAGMFSSDKIPE